MREVYKHIVAAAEEVEEQIEARPKKFRVSSSPYCPLLDVLDRVKPEGEDFTYKSHFYFGVGHAVHFVWQTAMVNSEYGEFCFGGWKCFKCKKLHSEKYSFRPAQYSLCCQAIWEYVEVELEYRGLSGHIDMLVCYPILGWIIYDLKTTSSNILARPQRFLPFKKNVYQIATYCVLLRWIFGFKISHFILLYASRDNPSADDMYPAVTKFKATDYVFWSNLVRLWLYGRRCADRFLASPNKSPDELIESRPCHSKEQYEKRMDGAFFQAHCPYFKSGVCGKPDVPLMKVKMITARREYLKRG